MKILINTLIWILLILISAEFIKNQNTTECYKMYLNKTINTNCFNETACCYYDYIINQNQTIFECVLKVNNTENICLQYSRLFTYHPSAVFGECDCESQTTLEVNFTILVVLSIVILVF